MKRAPSLVLLSAGKGKRFGGKKQLLSIDGVPLFFHALFSFCAVELAHIVLVVDQIDLDFFKSAVRGFTPKKKEQQAWWKKQEKRISFVVGGDERWISSAKAIFWLDKLSEELDTVIVHDAARPLLASTDLQILLETWENCQKKELGCGVVAARILTDTIKRVKKQKEHFFIDEHVSRNDFLAVSTPQIFSFECLKKAYEKVQKEKNNKILTDDSEVIGKYCTVQLCILKENNPKLTYVDQLDYFNKALTMRNK